MSWENTIKGQRPDYPDLDGDGDTDEPMVDALETVEQVESVKKEAIEMSWEDILKVGEEQFDEMQMDVNEGKSDEAEDLIRNFMKLVESYPDVSPPNEARKYLNIGMKRPLQSISAAISIFDDDLLWDRVEELDSARKTLVERLKRV